MPTTARSASRDKVRAHRTRLRKAGLRPVQIWVPDVRLKCFAQAAHRQSLAVAQRPHAKPGPLLRRYIFSLEKRMRRGDPWPAGGGGASAGSRPPAVIVQDDRF